MSAGPDGDEAPLPGGRLRGTSPGAIIAPALFGLVLGWLVRPLSVQLDGVPPTVGWLPVLTLAFAALMLGSVAWGTHRTLHRRGERLVPEHAVNRLVLAKACAAAGAFVAGGYFGYAWSWVGIGAAELATQRMVRAVLGGVAGTALVVCSLLLERACRVGTRDG